MTPKEYLRQARTLLIGIHGKRDRITQLRALAESVSPEPRPKLSAVASCIVDLTDEIAADALKLVQLQRDIQQRINRIERPEHRVLLELYYLNGLTFEQVAERMHFSDRHVRTLHGKALQQIDIETVPVISAS